MSPSFKCVSKSYDSDLPFSEERAEMEAAYATQISNIAKALQ